MTGFEAINTPNTIHSAAPSICKPRNIAGLEKKYEATNTAVAVHPTVSATDKLERLTDASRLPFDIVRCSAARRCLARTIILDLRTTKLRIVERAVGPFARQQRLVRSLLDDMTIPHHQDQIRIADRR